MICAWCGTDILPGERFLRVDDLTVCQDCVEDEMEEFDPEGEEIDMQTDEMIERRFNNG